MKAVAKTDVGRKRKVNQDYMFACKSDIGILPNLFMVADGMGGHNAGDVASRCCVETMVEQIEKSKFQTPISILEEAIKAANRTISEQALLDSNLRGMGTTLVAATIIGTEMYVANIGDSRAYLINDKISQITEDHSLVEEMVREGEIEKNSARSHPNKNIITRALGTSKTVLADFFEITLKENDIALLCSDGLTNMLDDEVIFDIVSRYVSDIETAAEKLIEKANEFGGLDNIAVVLVKKE